MEEWHDVEAGGLVHFLTVSLRVDSLCMSGGLGRLSVPCGCFGVLVVSVKRIVCPPYVCAHEGHTRGAWLRHAETHP